MKEHPLFRSEALRARQILPYGTVVLAFPISITILTAFATVVILALVGVMFFGTYTKKIPTSGQLLPSLGLVKIYAPNTGVVVRKVVSEGQNVVRGTELLEIADEVRGINGQMRENVASRINTRRTSLQIESGSTEELHKQEKRQLESRVESLKGQLVLLSQQLGIQQSQVVLAEQDVLRHNELVSKGFISENALLQKKVALLEQQNKLETAKREQETIKGNLSSASDDLAITSYKNKKQLAQLERELATEDQSYIQNDASKRQIVVAAESGMVASINTELGQHVSPNRPLLSVVPLGSRLQAELYVPSRAIGFIREGQSVNLRYRAYPYQRFGLAKGTIVSVSKSAISSKEVEPTVWIASGESSEPLFRIIVALQSQVVTFNGVTYPLHTGMIVDGDLLVERKPLYQWVLDPLYGATLSL